MGRTLDLDGFPTEEEIEAAYRASEDKQERERLFAMRLARRKKWTLEEMGEIVGRGKRTIERWVEALRQGGLRGLLERKQGGRQASVGESDLEALKEG